MNTRFKTARAKLLAGVLVAATVATSPVPAIAQDEISEARLRKIEAEIRALQRNVFPGGDGTFFEPQISPSERNSTSSNNGVPSTTAVTDILARLDAIELQLQRLTALSEENGNSMSQLEERVAALETVPAVATTDEDESGATETNLAAMTGGESGSGAAPEIESATGPSAERLAAVRAITKPQTDDPADDDYSYGYRLWNAGYYPEARQALSDFVEKYPTHWRTSYGRNLLGRAYLDDGMAEEAARWFLKNYQADKQAARAPDSLLYLAESMIEMNDTRRACIALSEFGATYPAEATGRLSTKYAANNAKVNCEADEA